MALMNWKKRFHAEDLEPGEQVLAAFQCRSRGWIVAAAAGQVAGAAAGGGAVGGAIGGATTGGIAAAGSGHGGDLAGQVPRGDILFVVTDRRAGIFKIETDLTRGRPVPYLWFALGVLTGLELGQRLTTRTLTLHFADGTVRHLRMLRGQGDPHTIVQAFARVPATPSGTDHVAA